MGKIEEVTPYKIIHTAIVQLGLVGFSRVSCEACFSLHSARNLELATEDSDWYRLYYRY